MTPETYQNETKNGNQDPDVTLTETGVVAEAGVAPAAKTDVDGEAAAGDSLPVPAEWSPAPSSESSTPGTVATTERANASGAENGEFRLSITEAMEWVAIARNSERVAVDVAADGFFQEQRAYLLGVFAAIGASDAVVRRVFTDLEDDFDDWHDDQFAGKYVVEPSREEPEPVLEA